MIRNETDYRNHIEYCWGNPVKHGFVTLAADWPYSSLNKEIARGLVAPDWSGTGYAVGRGSPRHQLAI